MMTGKGNTNPLDTISQRFQVHLWTGRLFYMLGRDGGSKLIGQPH